ncbi:4'-phosphopantetheinyl transferase family protein [Janthinobacterium agaricidamnosum]|nr:4'-phosphopantetheinyl transferase superfamily protein [Janthinobacterium agaricidamnosum]
MQALPPDWPAPAPSDNADAAQLRLVTRHWSICGRAPMQLVMAGFDPGDFKPGRFGQAGIQCPEQVARSVNKRQAEFFFGRSCARAALAGIGLGLGDTDIPIGAARQPLWPAGVLGSITHSHHVAAALVLPASQYGGIGIDIETVGEGTLDFMHGSIVSAHELAYLRTLQDRLDLNTLLTLVFSAKESFFKAAFGAVQRLFDFDAVHIERIDVDSRTISFALTETLCPQFQQGTRWSAAYAVMDRRQIVTGFLW